MTSLAEHGNTFSCPVDHKGKAVAVRFAEHSIPVGGLPPAILVHDLGENGADCVLAMDALYAMGFDVYTFDQRSFNTVPPGSSRFQALAIDLLQVVALVKRRSGGRRPVVIAQGFGALLTLTLTKSHRQFFHAVGLVSPLLSLQESPRPLKRLALRFLARFFSEVRLPQRLYPRFADRHRLHKQTFTAGMAMEVLVEVSRAKKNLNRIAVPILIIHAKQDPICRYEFLKRLLSKNRSLLRTGIRTIDADEHLLLSAGKPNAMQETLEALAHWLRELETGTHA